MRILKRTSSRFYLDELQNVHMLKVVWQAPNFPLTFFAETWERLPYEKPPQAAIPTKSDTERAAKSDHVQRLSQVFFSKVLRVAQPSAPIYGELITTDGEMPIEQMTWIVLVLDLQQARIIRPVHSLLPVAFV